MRVLLGAATLQVRCGQVRCGLGAPPQSSFHPGSWECVCPALGIYPDSGGLPSALTGEPLAGESKVMPGGPTRSAWPKPTLAWTLGQLLNVDLNPGGAGAT